MANDRIRVKRLDGNVEYHYRLATNDQRWQQMTLDDIVYDLRAEGFVIPQIKRMLAQAHAQSHHLNGDCPLAGYFVGGLVAAGFMRLKDAR